MDLNTQSSVQKLQAALHARAKGAPAIRFHALYDKVYRMDFLKEAYARCKANKGASGVDHQRFEDIEEYGVEQWLEELSQDLRNGIYKPLPVRRVNIPKPDGKLRPLGIPVIRDRVAQMAAVLVLEPIFEADLQPEQHAYRRNHSAQDALRAVHNLLRCGHTQVIDADLSGYFDTIPHAELMQSLARRIVDGKMLHLIKMWLEAPVQEVDEKGHMQRTTRNRDEKKGTPQGAPISPLLSNVYMRRFILGWKQLGYEKRFRAFIVNYADDFVICCKGPAQTALLTMRSMMGKLRLTVNESKTHLRQAPQESFDFLGYTFGRCHAAKTGERYLGRTPSKKRVQRLIEKITDETSRSHLHEEAAQIVVRLNRIIRGWGNYFSGGTVSKVYGKIDYHARNRMRRWLRNKHKRPTINYQTYPDRVLHKELGLISLAAEMATTRARRA